MIQQTYQSHLQPQLSQQQIKIMKLIQLTSSEFEYYIYQEFEVNTALEFVNDSYSDSTQYGAYVNPFKYAYNSYFSSYPNFYEYLKCQLKKCKLHINNYIIALMISYSININGYININYYKIIDTITRITGQKISVKRINFILVNYIHKLLPCGVGSRNLKECLLIQIKNKMNIVPLSPFLNLSKKIIQFTFESFYKKNFYNIKEYFNISNYELKLAISNIGNFNHNPGFLYNHQNVFYNSKYIIPDFILRIYNGKLVLSLYKRNLIKFRISSSYKHIIKSYKKQSLFANSLIYLKKQVNSAKSFIDAVTTREKILILIMNVLLYYQKIYFFSGQINNLRPMTFKDIAYYLNMDISTISRVISNKVMVTPYKNFLIKELFSEGISKKDGQYITTRQVKSILNKIINSESKKYPLTDEKITIILQYKGYNVARRTISKYRDKLHIPIYRLRKQI